VYFNVNFIVFFKLIKLHLLVSELCIYQNARCNDKKKIVFHFVVLKRRDKDIHALPTTPDSKLSSLNVSESSVTIPDVHPTSKLHNSLNIQPIPVLIRHFTDKFFAYCPLHANPPPNYILADLICLYKKKSNQINKHKRTKHKLL